MHINIKHVSIALMLVCLGANSLFISKFNSYIEARYTFRSGHDYSLFSNAYNIVASIETASRSKGPFYDTLESELHDREVATEAKPGILLVKTVFVYVIAKILKACGVLDEQKIKKLLFHAEYHFEAIIIFCSAILFLHVVAFHCGNIAGAYAAILYSMSAVINFYIAFKIYINESLFFVLLSLWVITFSKSRRTYSFWVCVAGVVFGFAVMINPRVLSLLFIFVFVDVVALSARRAYCLLWPRIKKYFWFGFSAMLLPVSYDTLLFCVFNNAGIYSVNTFGWGSWYFFRGIIDIAKISSPSNIPSLIHWPLFPLDNLFAVEGPVTTAILLFSFVAMVLFIFRNLIYHGVGFVFKHNVFLVHSIVVVVVTAAANCYGGEFKDVGVQLYITRGYVLGYVALFAIAGFALSMAQEFLRANFPVFGKMFICLLAFLYLLKLAALWSSYYVLNGDDAFREWLRTLGPGEVVCSVNIRAEDTDLQKLITEQKNVKTIDDLRVLLSNSKFLYYISKIPIGFSHNVKPVLVFHNWYHYNGWSFINSRDSFAKNYRKAEQETLGIYVYLVDDILNRHGSKNNFKISVPVIKNVISNSIFSYQTSSLPYSSYTQKYTSMVDFDVKYPDTIIPR